MAKNDNRLFNFEDINKEVIHAIFLGYNTGLNVQNIFPITTGMSTSNYMVEANDNKYLLKIYPKNNDHSAIELAAYRYAHSVIKVPEILHHDGSKSIIDNNYVIFQYIDGVTLRDYVAKNKCFSTKHAYRIGSMLALLHRKEYICTAVLIADLSIEKKITPFKEQYELFLKGMPGEYLSKDVKRKLEDYTKCNRQLIDIISESNVFCHGDLNTMNILVKGDTPWFIDFEYCFSMPRYYDIGKLFRTRDDYSEYIDDNMKSHFVDGYNSISQFKLHKEWYKLSRMADIVSMLGLINRRDIPVNWIKFIEEEILITMKL